MRLSGVTAICPRREQEPSKDEAGAPERSDRSKPPCVGEDQGIQRSGEDKGADKEELRA